MIYIDEHPHELDLAAALEAVGTQRREYAMRYRRDEDRRLCLAAHLLLQRALHDEYGIDWVPDFTYGPNGKPALDGVPDVHFSISHCREAVVCAVADAAVGVDVESTSGYHPDLLARTMNDGEQREILSSPRSDIAFIRLWTMKESLLKLTGEGMRNDLKSVLDGAPNQYHFTSWVGKNYVVTLCERLPENVK